MSLSELMFEEHRTEMNEIVSAIVDMPALPDLPPGGGLCSKRRLIEDLHTKFLEEIRSKEDNSLSPSGPLSVRDFFSKNIFLKSSILSKK